MKIGDYVALKIFPYYGMRGFIIETKKTFCKIKLDKKSIEVIKSYNLRHQFSTEPYIRYEDVILLKSQLELE